MVVLHSLTLLGCCAVAAIFSPSNGHCGEFVLDIQVCVCTFVYVTHCAFAALCALV